MRLEIIIPNSTRPNVKSERTSLTQRLSAKLELVEEIQFYGDTETQIAGGCLCLDPSHIEKLDAKIDAGDFKRRTGAGAT